MQQIWYLSPADDLADAVAPHLDRAGVEFVLADAGPAPENSKHVFLCGSIQDAEAIARQIIEADGKEFVPITPGECLETAVRLGLFSPKTDWQSPLTRQDAAVLAIRLLSKFNQL